MSYSLFFESVWFAKKKFQKFAINNPNYKIGENQATYENNDTGVYFILDFYEKPEKITGKKFQVELNLNYMRPTFFIKETMIELEKFCKIFSGSVYDPQAEQQIVQKFNPQKFFETWIHGLQLSREVINRTNNNSIFFRSKAELDRHWGWNYKRDSLVDNLDENIYIPLMKHLLVEGEIYSCIVWTDCIPVIVPDVEMILVLRNELATGEKHNFCLLSKEDFSKNFDTQKITIQGIDCFKLKKPDSKDIEYIKSLQPIMNQVNLLPLDQVLEKEYYQ